MIKSPFTGDITPKLCGKDMHKVLREAVTTLSRNIAKSQTVME